MSHATAIASMTQEAATAGIERRCRALMENISDAIALLDMWGTILYCGPSIRRILGYEPENNLGRSAFDLIHPDDCARAQQEMAELGRSPGSQITIAYRLLHQDGTWRDMEGSATNLLDEPGVDGIIVTYRDMTERKRAEEALRESEERYRSVIAALDEGIIVHDAGGRITATNPAAERIFGLTSAQMLGKTPRAPGWLTIREDGTPVPLEEHPAMIALDTGKPQRSTILGLRAPDDRLMWLSINSQPLFKTGARMPYAVVSSFTDITERKSIEQQLVHAAHHDSLTDLSNRTLFMDQLKHHYFRVKRRKHYRFALFFLDFDQFKTINDNLGHAGGDLLLIAIAQRLHACVRPTDTIARLGGDEIAILIEEVEAISDAVHIAERIHIALAAPHMIRGQQIRITASIGIALGTPEYARPEDILTDADTAMYRAKAEGGGQYAIAEHALG